MIKKPIQELNYILEDYTYGDKNMIDEIDKLISKLEPFDKKALNMHLYNKSFHQEDVTSLDNTRDNIYSEVYIALFGEYPIKEEFLDNDGTFSDWEHQQELYSEKNYDIYFDIYNQLNS